VKVQKNLQRGTAAAAALGGKSRHVHQLGALCPFFDQMENIYCAMQPCTGRVAPVFRTIAKNQPDICHRRG
jgi:hypothetical protein